MATTGDFSLAIDTAPPIAAPSNPMAAFIRPEVQFE
jgi:hypothetical protein